MITEKIKFHLYDSQITQTQFQFSPSFSEAPSCSPFPFILAARKDPPPWHYSSGPGTDTGRKITDGSRRMRVVKLSPAERVLARLL